MSAPPSPRRRSSPRRRHRRSLAVALAATILLCGGAALALAGSASASTVFSDDFEDGDTAGWSKSGGTWSVVSDDTHVLAQTKETAEPSRLFTGSDSWTGDSVAARVRPTRFSSATALVGLLARSTSSTSFVRLALLGSGRAELQSVNSGAVSVLATSAGTYAAGAWHTLRIEAAGRTVRGLVDGTPFGSGSTPLAAGRLGLMTAGATASFDDVTVVDSPTAPPTTAPPTTAAPTTAPTTTTRPTSPPTTAFPTTAPPTTAPTTAPTTTAPPTTPPGGGGPTSPTAPWPAPTGQVKVSSTIEVTGRLDGADKRYYGIGDGGQSESQPPMFELADGASLSNVILGAPAGDGVHCLGSCTLTNVWWEDVGEDAATFLSTSPAQTMTVDGGGARGASDKVFQHNGPGTFVIRNFQVSNFGKLYRSCGNCSVSYKRDVVIDNVVATAPGKALVGINTNFGDTAKLSRIVIVGDPSRKLDVCVKYRGVQKGSEPTEIGTGPDSTSCLYQPSSVSYR